MLGPRLWPRRAATALAVCLLAALALPIHASASPGPVAGLGQLAQVTLHGTGGYRIDLFGVIEGAHSTVTLRVSKGSSSADYATPGTITPTAIHASFGKLGKVALRFRSFHIQHTRLPKKCRSKGSPVLSEARLGVLAGTLRFRGEGDYTHVSAHRVKGGIGEWPAVFAIPSRGGKIIYFCATSANHGPGAGQPRHSKSAFLAAHTADEAISFFANTEPESRAAAGEAIFVASVGERQGKVKISRAVGAIGPAADFLFDSALSTATVSPPAPFSDTGAFQRGPDGSTSWTGSIAVPFPGRGPVALAGPAFKASLKAE